MLWVGLRAAGGRLRLWPGKPALLSLWPQALEQSRALGQRVFGLEQEVRRRDDASAGLLAQLEAAQRAAAAQREVAAEESERTTRERSK
jgi:hypothetical protein